MSNHEDIKKYVNILTESLKQESVITEASEYHSSADFESDVYEINEALLKAKKVSMSPSWKSWMRSTDMNYGTKGKASYLANELEKKILDAQNALDDCIICYLILDNAF